MSWDRKRNDRRYYYRSLRVNGRCRKEYVGTGPLARMAAGLDKAERQQRRAAKEAWLAEQLRLAAIDQAVDDLRSLCGLLSRAALILGGYHEHRGIWRQRRRRPQAR